jgi:hypothetical protein
VTVENIVLPKWSGGKKKKINTCEFFFHRKACILLWLSS